MKKDVIYVDIEDDITSIIAKVKGAAAPIVALVPPKRIGVLQSIVNLKLLQRAATGVDKRVVLITNDTALSGLAAGLSIPVAKNLQSKPEVAEVTALEMDDEDVINGEDMPIGILASSSAQPEEKAKSFGAASFASKPEKAAAASTTPLAARAAANAPKKGSSKLPNFDSFRKKLFFIGGGVVALTAFLIWALAFAPHATVTITAQTNTINISQVLQLKQDATLDADQHILPAVVQQTKKTTSVDFEATGKKEIGEKASGTVNIKNCDSNEAFVIPAGSVFKASSGETYTNGSAVTVPGFSGSASACRNTGAGAGRAAAIVVANTIGPEYNIESTSYSVAGVSGDVTATGTAMSGGSKQTVTVVSEDDIAKAREQLQSQDANSVKNELKKQFESDEIIITESFKADAQDPASTPRVGEQVSGKAKLTAETTYTLVGVKRSDLKSNFDAYLKAQLTGKEDQKVYASGDNGAQFSQFTTIDGGYTTTVSTGAQVGPQIDETAVKAQLVGKRSGEIQQQLTNIEGVENVETKFSPFWVTKAPGENKITVKFLLKNDAN